MSNWQLLLLLCTGTAFVVGLGSILILRPVMRRSFGEDHQHRNELLVILLTTTGLFYGLLLGLTAAASYGDYSDAEQSVAAEAAAVGALYRDSLAFPAPAKGQLSTAVGAYNAFVINVEWPAQRRGATVTGGEQRINTIQRDLVAFKPVTVADGILDQNTTSDFGKLVQARAQRQYQATRSLPAPLWVVLLLGAVITVVLVAMVGVKTVRIHLVMSGLFSVFLGMMIFFVIAFSSPFSGVVPIHSEAYQQAQEAYLTP